jgi:hypothetical protein
MNKEALLRQLTEARLIKNSSKFYSVLLAGAITFIITTSSIMTLSIKGLFVILSVKVTQPNNTI